MNVKSVASSLAAYALKQSTIIHIPSLNVYIINDEKMQEEYEKSAYDNFEDFCKSIYPELWQHYIDEGKK